MRKWDDPEVADLPGSGNQPTLLVEVAEGADHINASPEVFGHLIFVARLSERAAAEGNVPCPRGQRRFRSAPG